MSDSDIIVYDTLLNRIKKLIEISQTNNTMNACYWEVGKLIDQYSINNQVDSSFYKKLSVDLGTSNEENKNFHSDNLKKMRQFFNLYPGPALKILNEKSDSERLAILTPWFPLKWSLYSELLLINEPHIRESYETWALNGDWDAKRLKFHIEENLYRILHKRTLPFEFQEFKDEYKNSPMLLYRQAQDFYDIFKPFLEYGYQPISESPRAYTWGHLLAYIVNFHFYIELMLKAIIKIKKEPHKNTHNLEDLLKDADIIDIFSDNENCILKMLSQYFNCMRYREGSLQTRNLSQEFLEILRSISSKVEQRFTEVYNEHYPPNSTKMSFSV